MDEQRDDAAAAAAGLVRAGLVVLTLTSGVAIYRAAGDVGSIAFVATSYAMLPLLFHYLRAYELVDAAERERLRRKVWCLCTALTTLFAWKVAGVMPPAAAVAVWLLAVATSAGGFVVLFHRRP
ncbi:hypothetical protein E2562_004745 [Oryza meyeriana var. granulata]|uniref:Uncharacterized protein n=1 Tax=Oryza meyeriana var. granulata TaxID=110450 RepID=A0A6G1DE39_9ORYZ|nr:hypothetical protein E2562_004745 [Oryza meyeriana var. granulata]